MSSVEQRPNLILGQGQIGAALAKLCCRKLETKWMTWSKSGRANSTFSGDIATVNLKDLPSFNTVVIILSPRHRTEREYCSLYSVALHRLLKELRAKRVIFCSSTVVYPPSDRHQWCSEDCEVLSHNYRAKYLLAAEKTIEFYYPNSSVICRLTGLVDDEQLLKQRVQSSSSCWLNYVFRHDVVNILFEFIKRYDIAGTYNISSDHICYNKSNTSSGKKVSNLKLKSVINYSFKMMREEI